MALLLLLTAPAFALNYDWLVNGYVYGTLGVVCGLPGFITVLLCLHMLGEVPRGMLGVAVLAWVSGVLLSMGSLWVLPLVTKVMREQSFSAGFALLGLEDIVLTTLIFWPLARLYGKWAG